MLLLPLDNVRDELVLLVDGEDDDKRSKGQRHCVPRPKLRTGANYQRSPSFLS